MRLLHYVPLGSKTSLLVSRRGVDGKPIAMVLALKGIAIPRQGLDGSRHEGLKTIAADLESRLNSDHIDGGRIDTIPGCLWDKLIDKGDGHNIVRNLLLHRLLNTELDRIDTGHVVQDRDLVRLRLHWLRGRGRRLRTLEKGSPLILHLLRKACGRSPSARAILRRSPSAGAIFQHFLQCV